MSAAVTHCPSAAGSLNLDDVLRRYGNLVLATVRSFQLQDADTLDAVQMTWLRLVETVHQVQFPEALGGWLVTVARHECLRIRCEAGADEAVRNTEPDAVADSSVGPEQRVIDARVARLLWDVVAELSPRQQAVLRELFTGEPRPYVEVAQEVGIPVGGIGPTRARALQQLRGRLDAAGIGPATWR